MIIDFHTHTFPDAISAQVIDKLTRNARVRPFTDASRSSLFASMKKAGIDYAVNLPVHTSVRQVYKVNRDLIACHEEMMAKHYLTLGGIHPDYPNCRDELKFLKDHGILGVKLHPSFQQMDLTDTRMMHVIAAASELDMIVVIHAGIDVGHRERDYASVPMILKVIGEIQPPKFVLAHMGGWGEWDLVEKYLAGAPVWFDTAFSLGPVHPNPYVKEKPLRTWNLTDAEFLRLARKHGTDHVLFGSDVPWSDQSAYVGMMNALPLSDEEREQIMWKNAAALLGFNPVQD